MTVQIRRVEISEKDTLANLLEKYLYEFSQYDKRKYNDKGLFGYKYLDNYFTDNDRFAYFITVDGELGGFALINKYCACERPVDWSVAEFFVSYNYRRQGVATRAVDLIFENHKGFYHIKYHKENVASAVLWNNAARKYSGDNYELCASDDISENETEWAVLFFKAK